ncbi:glycine--tRNA ligase subunit beta [Terracidiphilus gabretensis]|uniref:glycine--tRNA ligase subunit beta n=1 Tax=Terracidiphilus gabretensis TaxID=1577687 RepID=UPI00071B5957|nr:glycine--tRNA ligase subunit beta [Terracidiphilus gabretensis]
MANFLLEIGLEEIPARMIAGAEAELGRRVTELLTRERLLSEGAKVTTFSTPRRLAVLAEGVLAGQADTEEQLTGPSWKIAFKDDAPTAAAEAFAKKAGVAVNDLEKVTTPKGEYVGAKAQRKGRATAEILAGELPKEVLAIYWAKNMYWRASKPERFVRPLRWLVALLDSEIVPVEITGIAARRASRGHRVLHGEKPVEIAVAGGYVEALRGAKVVVEVSERRQLIRKALDKATRTVAGARWREDEPLVETVTHLTEWPSVILGDFEPEYLTLPEEVLVTVMRDHQKYFAVEGAEGKLAPHFLAVLNTEVDAEGEAIIRHGNAKVLRARFKDAQFFWDFDQKVPLAERVESLKAVTYHKDLGNYYWKTEENLVVAGRLASVVKAAGVAFDEAALLKAAELAKTDLTTELVKEFTELQGIIGGLYARAQGLDETVAKAIYDQYTPASTEDAIPTTVEGQLLGLADRIQTITAMFGIGFKPTGSKDPFALRRAGNGIIKILAESDLELTLDGIYSAIYPILKISGPSFNEVQVFLGERVKSYLMEARGFAYDVVNAVTSAGSMVVVTEFTLGAENVRHTIARAEALTAARGSEDFVAVSAAFKRIKNILRQAEEKKFEIGAADGAKLASEAQKLLAHADELAPKVRKYREDHAYTEALSEIATLRPSVDAFFDKVMVLDNDPAVRGANLGLIASVLEGFSGIADFSEIVTG